MLNEISQEVKGKYHMISSLSGTKSIKQTSKQNRTRDIEIKNKLTVTRAGLGGNNGGKGGRVVRNMNKGHMDKAKGGLGSRVGGGDRWGGGNGGGEMETITLEQQ